MSYYSDVMIKCKEKTFGNFVSFFNFNKVKFTAYQTNNNDFFVEALNIEWNKMESLDSFYAYMDSLEEEHTGDDDLVFCFMRIGEEVDDIEYFGNDDNYKIRLKKQILVDDNATKLNLVYTDDNGEEVKPEE